MPFCGLRRGDGGSNGTDASGGDTSPLPGSCAHAVVAAAAAIGFKRQQEGDRMDEEVKAPESAPPTGRAQLLRRPRVRVSAVVTLALAAGIIAWLAVRGDNSTASPTTVVAERAHPGAGPVAISPAGLQKLQSKLGHPIYWAGPKPGYTYEVTQRGDGTIYVRYLPPGVRVGDRRGAFLIVVTYPYANALLALQRVQNGKGIHVPRGGLALVHQGYAKSVHLAYPGVNYQIEVYDPSPAISKQVATSGQVRPVG
jgi:hypothetical protein